jgi:hypothetical protein
LPFGGTDTIGRIEVIAKATRWRRIAEKVEDVVNHHLWKAAMALR